MEMSWKAKQPNTLADSQAQLPFECITLKQERRIEEAPGAYKPIGPVIQAQVEEGLVQPIARLIPLLTFKA
jgi:tRNA-splicing ligase RtcB